MSDTGMEDSAAVKLYPKMEPDLQKAFYSCYRNFGKISTKKLIASFVDAPSVIALDQIILQTKYDGVPSRDSVEFYEPTADIEWLRTLRRGPGVSPCVMRTCERLLFDLSGDEKDSGMVDTLRFLEKLSATAVELSRLVRDHKVDVPRIVADARSKSSETCS